MAGVFNLNKRRCSAEKEHLARNAIFFRTRGEFETKFSLQKSQKKLSENVIPLLLYLSKAWDFKKILAGTQKASRGNFPEWSQHSTTESLPGQYLICKGQLQNPLISSKMRAWDSPRSTWEIFLTLFHSSATDSSKRKVLPGCFHSRREGVCSHHRWKTWNKTCPFWRGKSRQGNKSYQEASASPGRPRAASQFLCSYQLLPVTPKGGFRGSASL